jgi:hypothetical protein
MRTGITQEQVNAAADALIAAGDKPTVEKIRAQLGTGSPNTVTRMLDSWRGGLAQRMQDLLKLPGVPAEAGQAFAEVWRLAVTQAESLARASLVHEQNALLAEQTELTQERKIWEIAIGEAQANLVEVSAMLKHTELQLTERQGLLAQTESQRLDLLQQRDRLQVQSDRLANELTQVRLQLTASESNAVAERDQASAYIRQVEDRASNEIDRTRQDIKALQQRFDAHQREHDKALKHLTVERDRYLSALRAAEQQLATEQGRAKVLQQQLSQSLLGKTQAKASKIRGKANETTATSQPRPAPSRKRGAKT